MGGDLFGIGLGELLFLAVLALVIFGPKRLPEIGRAVGRFLRTLREGTAEVESEARRWLAGELPAPPQGPPATAASPDRRSDGDAAPPHAPLAG